MTLGNLNSTFTLKGEEMGTLYYVFLKFLPQYSFLHDAFQTPEKWPSKIN